MRVRLHKYDLRPREPSRKRSILDSELPIDLAEGKALFSVKEKKNLKRGSRAILNVTFSSCTICLADYNKYRWGWFPERKFGQNGRFWSFLSVLFWFPSMERSASRVVKIKPKCRIVPFYQTFIIWTTIPPRAHLFWPIATGCKCGICLQSFWLHPHLSSLPNLTKDPKVSKNPNLWQSRPWNGFCLPSYNLLVKLCQNCDTDNNLFMINVYTVNTQIHNVVPTARAVLIIKWCGFLLFYSQFLLCFDAK